MASNLEMERMVDAATCFNDSFKHVMSNILGDTHNEIIAFVLEIVLKIKPYVVVTDEGLRYIIDKVFNNEHRRDFILMLTFTFYSRFGGSDSDVVGLASNIARGVGQTGTNKQINLIPSQIQDRLNSIDDTILILVENKWLVTILMLQLFISSGALIENKTSHHGKE